MKQCQKLCKIERYEQTLISVFAKFLTTTTMEIIFCHFLMPCQIFISPKIKRSVIISNKHGIYELPHELPNDLRLKILEN